MAQHTPSIVTTGPLNKSRYDFNYQCRDCDRLIDVFYHDETSLRRLGWETDAAGNWVCVVCCDRMVEVRCDDVDQA